MNKYKKFINQFFLIDDSPAKIASGASLVIFLGIIPGEGIFSTLFFAYIFRFNRLAALAGVATTNMWTTVAVLPLAAGTGAFIFHTNSQDLIQNFNATFHLGLKFFLSKIILLDLVLPLMVGFIVIAGIIAMVFYFLLYFLLKYKKLRFK